ncbi:hypothetical protein SLS62_007113 [Diatrype stigma]|uniref:Uncharacterized protein n=1 Tax=Diatrype stigma TaxID=117547 RepID=A0AAN9YR35_9PEZI
MFTGPQLDAVAPPYTPNPRPDETLIAPRPTLRHYFTRSSVWRPRGSQHYAAYDFLRHIFVNSTIPYKIPGHPDLESSDDVVELNEDYQIPKPGTTFPPKWLSQRHLKIYVNFKQDIFYFSTSKFPCVGSINSIERLENFILRASRGLRHRAELVGLPRKDEWMQSIEKLAIHAPSFLTSPHSFLLTRNDRIIISEMLNLKKIYLVVPRDPQCYHGPHRTWLHARANGDGFMPYSEFVALHTGLQNSALGGKPCNCFLDPDPTFGEKTRLELAFEWNDRPPEIIVVIEDLLR